MLCMKKASKFLKIRIKFTSLFIFGLFLLNPFCVNAATTKIGIISPSTTVPVGTAVSFKFDTEAYGLKYTIFDDSPQSTISNSNITQAGYFNWTPQEQDIGTHTLVFTVIDQNNTKTTLTQNLTIVQASSVSIQNISRTSAFPDESVSFGVAALGYVSPNYYVYDSFSGTSVSNANIDAYGNFNWKPTKNDVGVHNIQITVTNSQGRRDVVYQTITVNGIKFESVPGSVEAETTIRIPFKIYGISSPTYSIRDSFRGNTIDSAKIEDNHFIWRPERVDVGHHVVTVTTTEGSNISETTFSITVSSGISNSVQTITPVAVRDTVTSSATSVGVKKFTFTTDLKIGSKGIAVTELQKKLKAIGVYSGPITGTFGFQTQAGVKAFQKKYKISQIGTVGPKTRAELNR